MVQQLFRPSFKFVLHRGSKWLGLGRGTQEPQQSLATADGCLLSNIDISPACLSCMLNPTCSRAIGSAFCVSSLPCLGGALLLGIDVVKACVSMLLLLPSVDELLVSDVSLMHIRVHLFFQATMVGILILKLAYYQAGLVLLLMVLTYFAKSSLRGSYEPAALSLPLEIAKVRTCLELDRLPTRRPLKAALEKARRSVRLPTCSAAEH